VLKTFEDNNCYPDRTQNFRTMNVLEVVCSQKGIFAAKVVRNESL